jgi:hypothetical protein
MALAFLRREKKSMRRVLLTLGLLLLVAACTTPTPTPAFVFPTRTPQLYVTVVVDAPTRTITMPPTWTPRPTVTNLPTATHLPSVTPLPTATLIPTRTPLGGRPGVVSTEGLLTVEIKAEAFAAALSEAQKSVYFSSAINNFPMTVKFDSGQVEMSLNFNDFTNQGIAADFRLVLRPSMYEKEIGIDVLGSSTESGISLSPDQIENARQIMRRALLDTVIPDAVKQVAPYMVSFTVLTVSIEPDRVLIGLKISLATPTPGSQGK